MTRLLRPLLHALLTLHYFGPFVMGVMDSSFLFLPFGNDLLVVVMVARNHAGYPWYLISAVCGSVCGIALLDLVARKLGEAGVQRVAGKRGFEYLRRKIGERGGLAVALASISPPPFPFTAVISTVCALDYPRKKLLGIAAAGRGVRFAVIGYLAIRYGRTILRVANSAPFRWSVSVFAALCIVVSVFSILKWLGQRDESEFRAG